MQNSAKFTLIFTLNKFKHWEGQFIKITGRELLKYIVNWEYL